MTDDMIAWLTAQLDDDERATRAEIDLAERAYPAAEFDIEYMWARRATYRANGATGTTFAPGAPSPAERLAEIAAKRKLIDWVKDSLAVDDDYDPEQTAVAAEAEDVLRLLALPYADREGFRDEWRP